MQLCDPADRTAALGIDGDDGFDANLEIASNPNHARLDGAYRHVA